jgi:Mlc titration factor MtfA (ptsG expression regulator)
MWVVLALGFALLAPVVWWVLAHRRDAALAEPFAARTLEMLGRRVPLYRALPATLKPALHRAMRRFLLDKRFVGCDGFEITDEVRHIIAAQACLLVCRREHAQFDGFTSVLVYPDAFVVDVVDHDGEVEIVSEQTRAGESWAGGPVILSWADVEAGLDVPNDGYNVVLHEFAHKLDEENETGEGLPLLWDAAQLASWAQVLGREFAALSRGEGELLDDYGAVSPAEFFAVVTEHFFEQGAALAAGHPALYAEFRRYYGLDTASWPLSRAFA